MSNIITKEVLSDTLEQKRDDIKALLPSHVDVDRFIKSAMLAVMRDKNLLRCTKESIFTAIVNAGELGLDFTPARGHAYLVPYGNVATFMPGYKGFIHLARNSGIIKAMNAHVVHENDKFSIEYGSSPHIEHKPALFNAGPVIGAYAIAYFDDATFQYEFMNIDELDKIKASSKLAKGIPWTEWEEEMMKKSAIRRLAKMLPISPDIARAIEADNNHFDLDPSKEVKLGVAGLIDQITPDVGDDNKASTEAPKGTKVSDDKDDGKKVQSEPREAANSGKSEPHVDKTTGEVRDPKDNADLFGGKGLNKARN